MNIGALCAPPRPAGLTITCPSCGMKLAWAPAPGATHPLPARCPRQKAGCRASFLILPAPLAPGREVRVTRCHTCVSTGYVFDPGAGEPNNGYPCPDCHGAGRRYRC